jgi:hypothetical protein
MAVAAVQDQPVIIAHPVVMEAMAQMVQIQMVRQLMLEQVVLDFLAMVAILQEIK